MALARFRRFLHRNSYFGLTALRWGLGTMMFLAGMHKLFNPALWAGYTATEIAYILPVSPIVLMQYFHAPVEVIAGLAILGDYYTDIAATFSALSLFAIIFNILLAGGPVDTLIRDIGLLGLALAVAFLFGDSVQEEVKAGSKKE